MKALGGGIAIVLLVFIAILVFQVNDAFDVLEESTDPSQNMISDIVIVDNTGFKYIEFKQNGETKKINLDTVKTIELSDRDFSYYDYWRPYYNFYLTKAEYSKIFDENEEDFSKDIVRIEE